MNKFFRSLSLINVFILLLALAGCSSSNNAENKDKYEAFKVLNHEDKVSKMKEEVEFMCTKLEKKHKNLYHSISKEDFLAKKDEIIDELPNIEDDSEYYLELCKLISSLKDGHTRVESDILYLNDSKFYGFNIKKFDDDRWILVAVDKSNEDKIGYEVKAINNVDIMDIYNEVSNYFPHENSYFFTANFPRFINVAEVLKKVKVINSISDEEISIKLADKNGQEINIKVPSVRFDNIENQVALITSKAKPMDTSYDKDKCYWNKKLSNDVYYIQYNECREDDSLKMDKFTSEVKKDVEDNSFEKVIIDLRYNGGGNSRIIEPLYTELAKLKDSKNFKVYILIGNNTFSSALLNAYDGSKSLGAVLVGQPTGGNLNAYGDIKTFDLPYSGFTITYCTKYFEMVKGYEKDALYPDIECSMKLEDYLNGVDTVLQRAIDD